MGETMPDVRITHEDWTDEALEALADTIWTHTVFAGNPPSLMDANEREFWLRVAKYHRAALARYMEVNGGA